MIREPEIIDQLSRSEEYQDFERAFCETTQLSLRLRSLESCDLAGDGEGQQAQIMDVKAVPVRLGDKTIGVLELGLADQAKRLLTVPGPGVSEIAYQVGFQSLTQFNRLFRRIVGKSPIGFRRSLLKAECHAGQATSVN